MAQDLTVNIKTTSDVPAAMDRAKTATGSFAKQVDDIHKKFSTAFKDIFLGFTAPMVLLQGAIQMISGAIAKAKQDASAGIDLIAKGETVFASSEHKRMALLFNAKKQRDEELELIKAGKQAMTEQFLTETKSGKQIVSRVMSGAVSMQQPIPSIRRMSNMPDIQAEALKIFLDSPEGSEYAQILKEQGAKKADTFKGPEGFSNVVGVGANPVMIAMNEQLDEQRKQTSLLQSLVDNNPGQTDFTKGNPLNNSLNSPLK